LVVAAATIVCTYAATADICNLDADSPASLLQGRHIRIGLVSEELSEYDEEGDVWSGYDMDLLDKLAVLGNFTYSKINVGGPTTCMSR
jgi:hypothetical protein